MVNSVSKTEKVEEWEQSYQRDGEVKGPKRGGLEKEAAATVGGGDVSKTNWQQVSDEKMAQRKAS